MKKLHEAFAEDIAEVEAQLPSSAEQNSWSTKQEALVSGTNIKTINDISLLGSGNMNVGGGTFDGTMDDIDDGVTYVKTHNDYTDAEQTKLSGIATGAEVNVNADWNAGSGDAQILNKPTIITLLDVYPVGSIYISVVNTSPAILFGGTWVSFGAGKVLVGLDGADTDFDTVEETGGAKTVQSSAQSFSGDALAGHSHAKGTFSIDNESAHTHTYTQVPNHVHVQSLPSGQTGSQASGTRDASTTGSTADALSTANPTGGVATATTNAGSAHSHGISGSSESVSGGTPSGTNTPGAATSVVQPYIVVYMFKRTA